MNRIAPVIVDLLYLHDCVIVPKFGGFVAQYSSAIIDESTGFLSPPCKQILYNKNLINNDGLLANAFAQEAAVSYEEALAIIESEVLEFHNQLNKNKQVELNGLGLIFINNGVVQFKQSTTNFLRDAYGLSPLNINEFRKQIPKEETKVIPIDQPKRRANNNWWIAAAMIPFLFYLAWIPLKTDLLTDQKSFQYSDLNPFTFNKGVTESEPVVIDEPVNSTELDKVENTPQQNMDKQDEPIKETLQLNNVERPKPVEINKPTQVIEHPDPVIKQEEFHVVVGCFGKEKNAKKMLKKLTRKGFSPHEIDVHNNLHRIAAATFPTKRKALKFHRKLKKEYKISSWILKK